MKRIGVVGIPTGWSTLRLVEALSRRGAMPVLIDMARARLDLASRTVWHGEVELTALDAVIVKKIAPTYSPHALDRMDFLRFVKAMGTPVFSDPDSMYRLIDRLSCTMALRLGGIPMPPTTVTEDVDEALAAVESYGRAVCKPLYSSKARGMTVVQAGSAARQEIEDFQAAGNRVMYIQRMVSHAGGHLDLGVSFLGGTYLATYARQGGGTSWDTTTRTGGRYVPYEPGPEIVALAGKAQALFPGMAFTCVDVVETPDGAEIYEVSAFGGFRGLLDACGIDAAGLYADYVLARIRT